MCHLWSEVVKKEVCLSPRPSVRERGLCDPGEDGDTGRKESGSLNLHVEGRVH